MRLFKFFKEVVEDFRLCTGEVFWNRFERRVDNAMEHTIDSVPVLRKFHLVGPKEGTPQPNLMKEVVPNIKGKDWVNRIIAQAERADPPKLPPR